MEAVQLAKASGAEDLYGYNEHIQSSFYLWDGDRMVGHHFADNGGGRLFEEGIANLDKENWTYYHYEQGSFKPIAKVANGVDLYLKLTRV